MELEEVDVIWSGSVMLVRVWLVLGGHGQDGAMMVVGLWWKRGGGG